jgi:hypothetical protein
MAPVLEPDQVDSFMLVAVKPRGSRSGFPPSDLDLLRSPMAVDMHCHGVFIWDRETEGCQAPAP